jgi:hypothetical protein
VTNIRVIKVTSGLMNEKDSEGDSPLFMACRSGELGDS